MVPPANEKGRLVQLLCIGLSVFQVTVTYALPLNPLLHYGIFVAIVCTLIFVSAPTTPSVVTNHTRLHRWINWGWAISSLVTGTYFVIRFEAITTRWPLVDDLSMLDMVCGMVFLAAVFEATRRSVGWVLVTVMAVSLCYALFGHLSEGLFYHRPLSVKEVIDHLIFTGNGLFGTPVAVAATYVYVFILLGTALEISGGGDFLFRSASALTRRTRGGPAKVAVISSALYGSITGSPTANVMTTGLFTIPMMKRSGIRGEIAGAIESVASTGGALLPPVMGSAAFLMSELTGIDYLDILIAALIPSLLFYLGVLAQVHFGALKEGLEPEKDETVSALQILREGGHYLLPLLALVTMLLVGRAPMTAAGVAIAITILASWRQQETRIGLQKILLILEISARRSLLVTAACAAAGIVVGSIVTTGLGGKITSLIFTYAGGSLLLALLATMVVCIVLGMGMPVPSAYIVTAVLAGPPLALLGLSTMSAHLFILYFATLSAITPPVAVAAYAASGIAQASPARTALQAVRLGVVAFVIPFFFAYHPELLLVGSVTSTVIAVLMAVCGVLLIAGAFEGFMRVPIRGWARIGMGGAGLAFISPGTASHVVGLLLGIFLVRHQIAPNLFADNGSGST